MYRSQTASDFFKEIIMGAEKIGRPDLVDVIAKKNGISKVKANEVLGTVLDEIVASVASGKDVTIVGFGTFSQRARAARTGRNPATGAVLKIKASVSPGFKAGAGFKGAVAAAAQKKVKK